MQNYVKTCTVSAVEKSDTHNYIEKGIYNLNGEKIPHLCMSKFIFRYNTPVPSAPANGISFPAIVHELYDFSTVLCDCVIESVLKLNSNEVK